MHYIFSTILKGNITLEIYLICMMFSIILGSIIAFTSSRKKDSSKTLELSLIIMPAIVQTIIMMVNGNVGTGVAVAGTFSLIRFTSAAGTAKDISLVFLAMAAGLATGTGYLGIAVSLTIIICIVVLIVYSKFVRQDRKRRLLKIVMATDSEPHFEHKLEEFTISRDLIGIKTSTAEGIKKYYYHIVLKPAVDEITFIDTIHRKKNILEISFEKYIDEVLRL